VSDVAKTISRVTAALLIVAALASCRRSAVRDIATGYEATVAADVGTLRSATKAFQVLDSAVAAGYTREVANCLVHEHHGAMGYHHTNARLMDARAEVARPEILLYERLPSGEYRLNGVEYIVPYTSWSRDSAPPMVMGQRMLQEDNLKFWYLHVWAWNRNPDGLFANFHPGIQCPAAATKVFKPSGG
jgi:hypothetical protein